jgi:hypothetical protein
MRDGDGKPLVPIRHRVVPSHQLPAKHGVVAFLSSQEREGRWRLAPETRVASVLGNVELDLREADLSAGESVIEIFCLLGNVEIVVPPEVRVLNEGDSLGGNFALQPGDWDMDESAPILRITGSAYLGSVEIRQLAVGETPGQARRRRKKAKALGVATPGGS